MTNRPTNHDFSFWVRKYFENLQIFPSGDRVISEYELIIQQDSILNKIDKMACECFKYDYVRVNIRKMTILYVPIHIAVKILKGWYSVVANKTYFTETQAENIIEQVLIEHNMCIDTYYISSEA